MEILTYILFIVLGYSLGYLLAKYRPNEEKEYKKSYVFRDISRSYFGKEETADICYNWIDEDIPEKHRVVITYMGYYSRKMLTAFVYHLQNYIDHTLESYELVVYIEYPHFREIVTAASIGKGSIIIKHHNYDKEESN